MRTIVAVRAILARDSGRGMVDKPADKRRRVVTVATVRSRRNGYMTSNPACGIQSVMTGLARYGVACQYAVIEHAAHVVTRDVVANVTCLSNVPCRGVRIRR